ncbi:MAG: hypothetical protein ACXVC2_07765, partial [Bacteroidia bacterium]
MNSESWPYTKNDLIDAYKDRMTERETLSTIESLVEIESIVVNDEKLYLTEKGNREFHSILHTIKRENERHSLETESMRLTIDRLKNRKTEDKKQFWLGFTSAIIAAIISGIVPAILIMCQQKPQQINIDLPKVQIVHDTVFVKK